MLARAGWNVVWMRRNFTLVVLAAGLVGILMLLSPALATPVEVVSAVLLILSSLLAAGSFFAGTARTKRWLLGAGTAAVVTGYTIFYLTH